VQPPCVGTQQCPGGDNLFVHYDLGELEFSGQVEVEGEVEPFGLGGDSGSLIVDESRRALALLSPWRLRSATAWPTPTRSTRC
jgi:hypothetical protein